MSQFENTTETVNKRLKTITNSQCLAVSIILKTFLYINFVIRSVFWGVSRKKSGHRDIETLKRNIIAGTIKDW